MITGSNVSIRTIQEDDLSELFSLLSDIESKGAFLPLQMQSEVNFKNEFNKNGFLSDLSEKYIIISNQNKIIGLTWLFKSVPYFDAVEIGYQVFNSQNRRKGIATETVKLLSKYIFESRQVNRIEIRTAVDNKASEKVAQKSGFSHEGTNRQAAFSKGKHYDMHIYALLRSEWEANQNVERDKIVIG